MKFWEVQDDTSGQSPPPATPPSDQSKHIPIITIIGRPNVGKSTLFNRLVGSRQAIVDDIPGVTRDRHYLECDYHGHIFQLVDTGGLDPVASEGMLAQIRRQTEMAIAEADILIATMDGRAGLSPIDQEIARFLRKIDKPVFLAINKIDTPKADSLLADFYQLGQTKLYPVSAEHGLGVDDLLEDILPLLPKYVKEEVPLELPRIAVVGRPNTGKSTLVNTILGQDRLLVSDIPGTTRDPVDTVATYHGRRYIFTDTAGLRRRGRIERGIEGFSVARAIRALGKSDVGVLLLDGLEGITEQDTKIAGLILKQGRGCVLLVNKWDVRQDEPDAETQYSQELQRRLPFLTFAPVLFGSALKTQSLRSLFQRIDMVISEFQKRVPTGQLNQFLQRAITKNPIPIRKGPPLKAVFMTQVATKPPTFALFLKRQSVEIKPAYIRYIENALRDTFRFIGTPIRILLRYK